MQIHATSEFNMFYVIYFFLFILLALIPISYPDRRIKGGQDITADKRYAVYLLKAPDAPVKTPGWTCGGAIVSPSFVVTAAACVEDLQRIYVIAGYRRFVTSAEIEKDKCTSQMKKRVIYTCIPKEYNLNYNKTESWSQIDIALVKVETPFDFTDQRYNQYCSYIPTMIEINYSPKNQEGGNDALAMGWGHLEQYKEDIDVNNYNVETIKYTPTKILGLQQCLSFFSRNKEMYPVIKNYMICTLDTGNLDDKGHLIQRSSLVYLQQGCLSKKDKAKGMIGRTCEGDEVPMIVKFEPRRVPRKPTADDDISLKDIMRQDEELMVSEHNAKIARDSPGICQNDHGGPLVSWEGSQEVLIGVATLYKVDFEANCIGPFLFTSTVCAGSFLHCILSLENETDSGRRCETTDDNKFHVVQRRINWGNKLKKKRAEPVKIILKKRPQVPLAAFLLQ